MTIKKEELNAGVSFGLTVEAGRGVLEKDQPVIIVDDETVSDDVSSATSGSIVFGYVLVPNKEDGGKATIFFRARAVKRVTSYEAFSAGSLLAYKHSNTKISQGSVSRASGTITVVDFTWDGGETITVDDVVLTEGVDFTAGTSNEATARAIAEEINLRLPTVRATVDGAEITVTALELGEGNIALATDDDGADVTVSGETLEGADISALFPYGVAVQEATGADEEITAIIF